MKMNIRRLEWAEDGKGWWTADSPLGRYLVVPYVQGPKKMWQAIRATKNVLLYDGETCEAAQGMAQQDFDNTILSALDYSGH